MRIRAGTAPEAAATSERDVQRRGAEAILHRQVSPVFNEQLNHLRPALRGGTEDRRLAVLLRVVGIGTGGEQQARHLNGLFLGAETSARVDGAGADACSHL